MNEEQEANHGDSDNGSSGPGSQSRSNPANGDEFSKDSESPRRAYNNHRRKGSKPGPTWALANETKVLGRATVGVVFATLVLAIVGIFQVQIARDSLKAAHEDSVKAERPWVWATVESVERARGQLAARVVFKNYGKSAALNVVAADTMTVDQAPIKEEAVFAEFNGGFPAMKKGINVLPPGQSARIDVATEPGTKEKYLRYYETHDKAVVVVGRAIYRDVFGNTYQSDFCYYRAADGSILLCDAHNTMQ